MNNFEKKLGSSKNSITLKGICRVKPFKENDDKLAAAIIICSLHNYYVSVTRLKNVYKYTPHTNTIQKIAFGRW
jgi:hypothetical protein